MTSSFFSLFGLLHYTLCYNVALFLHWALRRGWAPCTTMLSSWVMCIIGIDREIDYIILQVQTHSTIIFIMIVEWMEWIHAFSFLIFVFTTTKFSLAKPDIRKVLHRSPRMQTCDLFAIAILFCTGCGHRQILPMSILSFISLLCYAI